MNLSDRTHALWPGTMRDASPNTQDTIFALSSAPGHAGVAVFRVSGPRSDRVLQELTDSPLPLPREARTRILSVNGINIDQALVLRFPGPASFTGEDVVEIMTHGSPAVVEHLAEAFLSIGIRQAAPGEFTRRAFLNGRMDLMEAEGLADLIDSETEAQRAQALRQMQGGLSKLASAWKESILDALAQVEGEIDFPDEEDVPDKLSQSAGPTLDGLISQLQSALSEASRGERVRSGLRVAVIGAPNAGKSSLINYLVGREAAIVSSIPGTTRDVVEVQLDIAGLPVTVADTAGLRTSDDEIEQEGIRRARINAGEADLRVLVVDATDPRPDGQDELRPSDFVLWNKTDTTDAGPPTLQNVHLFPVSVSRREGLDDFIEKLEVEVSARYSPTRSPGLTRARHRDTVTRARDALVRARANLDRAPELAGDDLRSALFSIEELAGRADMEAVLDRVFSRFCIGK